MPEADPSEFVEITHFINPHVFWLRRCNAVDRDFDGIERELQQYASRQHKKLMAIFHREVRINCGDRVAVYFVAWKKWLRCDIDVIDAKGEHCILWSIDYGFPFQSSNKLIVGIERMDLAKKCTNLIMKAAIATIVPFNGSKNTPLSKRPKRWASEAIDLFTEIMEKGNSEYKFKLQSLHTGQIYLGDLLLRGEKGQTKLLSEILIELNLAKSIDDATELFRSFERTTKIDRWISNEGKISSGCRSNEGEVEYVSALEPKVTMPKAISPIAAIPKVSSPITAMPRASSPIAVMPRVSSPIAPMPKAFSPSACLPPSNPDIKIVEDGGSVKSLCSESDVVKFFKERRRNARKVNQCQTKSIDSEWLSQQEKLNKSIIESKSKKPSAPAALAYTSLNKEGNETTKRSEAVALPSMTSAWSGNEATITQKNQIATNDLAKNTYEQRVNGEPKPIEIAPKEKPVIQPRQKNDLRATGETKIQTNTELSRILVHSEGLRIKPANKIGEVYFTPEIHRLMKNRYSETYKSQAYAWPHLMRNNSLILVDSRNRGKSVAYLPALCSRLQMHADPSIGTFNKSQLAMGPKAIILCANASTVESTAALCRWLMNRVDSEVVQAIGSRNIRDVAAKLFNGCNIFITTTPCLLNLMKSHADVFHVQKLLFFVFDNVDMVISRYGEEQLATIFKRFCQLNKDSDELNTQVVVTARTWHPALKRMRERMLNPLLLIGNFLEAALYGNMSIQVLCNFEAQKIELVQEHLKMLPIQNQRTLIVCNNTAEANDLSKVIMAKEIAHINVVSIDPRTRSRTTRNIEKYWLSKDGILLCTDETLKELKITNAQHVIHFSMPERFSDFLFRLSSSMDCYPNENAKSDPKVGRTSSLFLVDEKNNKQLPKLINLLERKGETFADNVLEICQKIRIVNDTEKAEKCQLESICNFLFMHGRSNHESACRERHLLMPSDVPLPDSDTPRSGGVRLKILNMVTPTRYSVQLLTVYRAASRSWQPINRSDAYMDFTAKFNSYYSDSNNHRDLLNIELNKLCVIDEIDGGSHAYHRGRIIKISEKKTICADDFDVDVRLIDFGTIVQRKSLQLRRLADEFCHFPEQAVDLHLIGLVPADSEDEWDSEITYKLKSHLNAITSGSDNIHVEANIVISLRKAIVVDCLRISQTIGRDCIIMCSVKRHMLQKRLGIGAKEMRKDIIKMAETIGIEIANQKVNQNDSTVEANGNSSCNSSIVNEKASVKSVTFDEPDFAASPSPAKEADKSSVNLMQFSPMASKASSIQNISKLNLTLVDAPQEEWASLSDSSFVQCDVTLYHSPDSFFITLQNDEHLALLDRIDQYVEQYEGIDTSMEMPDIGNFCLAKITGKYNRAKILSNSCENGIFCAKVFCCDIGVIETCKIEDIMSIPDELVDALPFQAIWCRLYGVKPTESPNGGWLTEASNKIYDDIIDPIPNLSAKMISVNDFKTLEGDDPFKMQQINVVLMSTDCAVNRLIVDQELAEFENNAERIIDSNCKPAKQSNGLDSDDDEEDEDEDEEWKVAGIVRQELIPQTMPVRPDIYQMCNDDAFDIQFDIDELAECMDEPTRKMLQLPKEIEAELKNSDSVEKEKQKDEEQSINDSDDDSCEDVPNKQKTIGTLKYINKVPYVQWQQSDELIVLTIKADENVKYSLEVTSSHLVFHADIGGQINSLVLRFFGCIDAEYTSHEVRGLNVIVRLKKTVEEYAWPQLTATNEKCHWLSYDYNAIKSDDVYLDERSFHKDKNDPADQNDSEYGDSESDYDDGQNSFDD